LDDRPFSVSDSSFESSSVSNSEWSSLSNGESASVADGEINNLITQFVSPLVGEQGQDQAPAIAVGFVSDHETLSLGFGSQRIGEQVKVDGETLFAIGSVSKMFVALILAKAVSDGDVQLATKVDDLLDDSLDIDERVTLQHLVTHRSGLPNFPFNLTARDNAAQDALERKIMPAKNYSRANMEACVRDKGCSPSTTPGTSFRYSNLGIGMLSMALQNHYGYRNSRDLIRNLVMQPLEMSSTCVQVAACTDSEYTFAQGYRYDEQSDSLTAVSPSDMGVLAGSGGLISNVNDMNRLLKVLTGLNSGALSSAAAEVNRELDKVGQEQPNLAVGYAHRIRHTPRGLDVHFKEGLVAGFSAAIIWLEEPKIGLVLLANRGGLKALMPTGMRLVASIVQEQQGFPSSEMGAHTGGYSQGWSGTSGSTWQRW
jgi:CubicO group peptidase (beta-lactamase class C family)